MSLSLPPLIPWQTPPSCTLYFIHILMGLATTLVHGRLWGVYGKLLLSLYSCGWQKRPLKRLSHPSFSVSLSFSSPPSFSLSLHLPLSLCTPQRVLSDRIKSVWAVRPPLSTCVCVCMCGVSAALTQKCAHSHKVIKNRGPSWAVVIII